MRSYSALARTDDQPLYRPIDPPFQVNYESLAKWQEVSGLYVLNSLKRRLGWESFADKKLLDLGCGVRFARTIYNLDIPFGLYVGVDVLRDLIEWMQQNVRDPRMQFHHLDAPNALYNKAGMANGPDALEKLGFPECDAACAFSVITHQAPNEARLTMQQLARVARRLYFTARLDDKIDGYLEQNPNIPGHLSTYHPDMLFALVEEEGWRVDAVYDMPGTAQNPVFLCTRV